MVFFCNLQPLLLRVKISVEAVAALGNKLAEEVRSQKEGELDWCSSYSS